MLHVDLSVFDFFENVVLMLGWIINNAFWGVLNQTMIAALPFLALILREWYRARGEGEDEGNKGLLSLNRIETTLYAMILIYAFTAFPLMNVQFAPANIDQPHLDSCGTRVATGPGPSIGGGAALGGRSAEMPIWWAVVHAVSTGLTNAGVAALPCQTNYQYIRTELNNTAIQDPKLREEVAHFQLWCYGAARAKLFQTSGAISQRRAEDTDWLGSSYFLTTPGYYDSIQAKGPVKSFAYDAARDFGRGTTPAQGGYPMCQAWWSAPGNGLEERLRNQIDPGFMSYFYATFSSSSAQDYAIRALLNNEQGGAMGNSHGVISGGGGGTSMFDTFLGTLLGNLGAVLGRLPAEGMKDALAHAMPMVQYLLMMALVIALPFLLVFSGYSFKLAGIATFSYFGLASLTFWFQLAKWLENHLIGMLYSSQATQLAFVAGLTSDYDTNILRIVQVAMLLVFPTFWIAMLGWTGARVGSGISGALEGGSRKSASVGEQGGKSAQSAATKGKA